MDEEEKDAEDALMRRRFDEWTFRGVTLIVPIVIALAGWALTLQIRLQEISTKQEERGPRIAAIERDIDVLNTIARDPAPKPETRVELQQMEQSHKRLETRLDRLEERFNNFHQFLLQAGPTIMKPPQPPGRRGETPLIDLGNRGG